MGIIGKWWGQFANRVKGWFGLRMYGSGYRRGLKTGIIIHKRWQDK